jgi:hypothetical protein
MSWTSLLEAMDNTVLNTFPAGGAPRSVTFFPQSGGSQSITGVIANPAMFEDYIPGSTQGVSVMRMFVRFIDITPSPQKGDQISISGVSYDVFEVQVDTGGGAVLKLRIKP